MLLPIIGGLFVIEALSVIIQYAFFKLTSRRVFKMAPIHHHFELSGWEENKIVVDSGSSRPRFPLPALSSTTYSSTTRHERL